MAVQTTQSRPWRWRAAGAVRRGLPDVRGRARLSRLVFGARDARTQAAFGPGLVFDLDLTDGDQFALWFLQYQQPALGPLLDRVLRPGDGFVDIGANVGLYACWAARIVSPGGWVHAYEALPQTCEVLRRHLAQNDLERTVEVTCAAVGDEPGSITLYTVPGASGWTSTYPRDAGSSPVAVPAVTVDGTLLGRRPRLVKIDVEGFEQHVLRGMTSMLSGENPPVVVLELSDRQLRAAGSSARALLGDIAPTGYDAWRITTRGLRPVTGVPTRTMNVVLLHPRWHEHEARLLRQTRFPRDWTT